MHDVTQSVRDEAWSMGRLPGMGRGVGAVRFREKKKHKKRSGAGIHAIAAERGHGSYCRGWI